MIGVNFAECNVHDKLWGIKEQNITRIRQEHQM